MFRYSEIASNDEAVKFYTGLLTCSVFEQVLAHLLSCSSPTLAVKSHTTTNVRLCDADCLLLTLMRLRLGLLVQDLAYRFGISESTVSDIFLAWIDAMYCSLKFLIKWPDQETCKSNMPQIFTKTCILRQDVSLIVLKYLQSDHTRIKHGHKLIPIIRSTIQ